MKSPRVGEGLVQKWKEHEKSVDCKESDRRWQVSLISARKTRSLQAMNGSSVSCRSCSEVLYREARSLYALKSPSVGGRSCSEVLGKPGACWLRKILASVVGLAEKC